MFTYYNILILTKLKVDVEWRTHELGVRGPGLDPTPKARTTFFRKNSHLPSFRQQT